MSLRAVSRSAFGAFGAHSVRWSDAYAVAALKGLVTACVLLAGFRAISDDDYARVVIAQRFAEAPSLDPSGTSWLPLPFYVYGAALRFFGATLPVAQAVAAVSGVLSTLCVLFAAHALGLGRRASFVAAVLAALLPHSVFLGAAAVPEALAAALCVFAAATLASDKARLWGGAALFVATGSRYEPWAVAALFALFSGADAVRERRLRHALGALLALAFPLLWLLHGHFRHGNATFFVTRVSQYRAALGPLEPLTERLLRTPSSLVTGEPELCLLGLAALGALLVRPPTLRAAPSGAPASVDAERALLARFMLTCSAVALLTFAGDLRGSGPTHHPERALLAFWYGLSVCAAAGAEWLAERPRAQRGVALGIAAMALSLGAFVRWRTPREPFARRDEAADIGRRARVSGVQRLAIDAPDYAYLAVQAGFGRPSHTLVLDEHDPRRSRPRDLLEADPQALLSSLRGARIPALALPRARAPFAHALGSVSEENSSWILVALKN